ncbi:MAG TPA: enoyl-CoA hydratase-related protein [Steroidobacteraceae bacterium]|jgi:enoyl-CoA hydratase/carnithine racemase
MSEDNTNEAVLVDRPSGHVMRATLNRPDVRNAVNGDMARGLEAAVDAAESDDDVRVVILAAAGDKSFCAGADLAAVGAGRGAELSTERGGFAGFVRAPRRKPWIAMVNSNALGGGLELCLACDMVVAARSARFGLPEVKRGIFAGAGGAFRLPLAIPRAVALEMLATGDPIHAERAFVLGLVNRVVDVRELFAATLALAGAIAGNAPVSVRESLALGRAAHEHPETEMWRRNSDAGRRVMATQDAKEGPRAFLEKRPPAWTGK